MHRNRFNLRLLFFSAISLSGDAIILTLVIIILSRFGIHTPSWITIFTAILLVGWTFISYFIMSKNPQFGFENKIGATGLTLDSLSPKVTIRIGHEHWAAKVSGGNIGIGVEVVVIGQNGLFLTVVKKN